VHEVEAQLTPLTVRPAVVVQRLNLRLVTAGENESLLRAALALAVPVRPDAAYECALLHLDRGRALRMLGRREAALAELDLGRVSYRAGSQMKMLRTMAPPRKITASLS